MSNASWSHYWSTRNFAKAVTPKQRLLTLADRALGGTRDVLVGQSWGPLVNVARTVIISLMEKISYGQLRVLTPDGIYSFGQPSVDVNDPLPGGDGDGKLTAEIRVVNDAFWVRMLILSDLGFAEAVLVGDIIVDDLDNVFKVRARPPGLRLADIECTQMFILNRSNLSEMSTGTSHLFSALNALMNSRFVNSVSNSISNISAHYDISNRMFGAFLSKDMTYSCAIYGPDEGGIEGDRRPTAASKDKREEDMLETAQLRKIRRVIERAHIRSGDRVLEIGSGWGSFAIEVRPHVALVDLVLGSSRISHRPSRRVTAPSTP
jgi:cyclopropane-fatty-acyl-phospholipid synthase